MWVKKQTSLVDIDIVSLYRSPFVPAQEALLIINGIALRK